MSSIESLAAGLFWPLATIGLYYLSKTLYRHRPSLWLSPLVAAPAILIVLALALHANYQDYMHDSRWLLALLGPATVAFAVPIYEQRGLIKRYWPVLLFGVIVGSATAMVSAWELASLLGLDESLRLSLMPRSVSTPFAMVVSGDIGGVPNLTAVFVVITGLFGAMVGQALLRLLPLKSGMARGALYGMGAHGIGVAKAHEIGREEGSIAGLVMVLVGLTNVLAAPLIAWLLHSA
ncbi:murein hydrolase effector protein LrgB [Rhizobium dioscoreae]|uniref:Murein hydrolase effector protein LrgB n=1 Tax=Rhizobium dioscoreae TaxID=2653122 RepID=A0ABQ0ZC29_9HYPH|nr:MULTISPECIES: LrgB family protein [Rhizobium]MCZ3380310.1 LrgB family protein [Rhizobium sp. AG207R]GES46959.1 murein hydrolase effector protein LrgB [Rhizobium dioscoreae]GES52813.1 murein hydrolase effector protein LrgB [Rhizobium dioscoreae]GLU81245.1 murein hydrolase effector protein LrgB [Rhizobium sp. NBRC 114257]